MGGDKGYDAAEFVAALRRACVTPHVAQKLLNSVIDGRTTRDEGYALSLKNRSVSRRPSVGRKPSVPWHIPSIAGSNGCAPVSS